MLKIAVMLFIWIICSLAFVPVINGKCCWNHGDFSCCGYGACNIFCCNCDTKVAAVCLPYDVCHFEFGTTLSILKFLATVFGHLSKQEKLGFSVQNPAVLSGNATAMKFSQADANTDGFLDHFEAMAWVEHISIGALRKYRALPIPSWFTSMDRNGDNLISPTEFDKDFYKI